MVVLILWLLAWLMWTWWWWQRPRENERDQEYESFDAAPEITKFGEIDAKYHAQYAKGTRKSSGTGTTIQYQAGFDTGDGNAGKNANATRTEDSWQDLFEKTHVIRFDVRNTQKSTGVGIVHNVQIKTHPNDHYPAFGLGQKAGEWSVKIGSRDSVLIKDKSDKPISATTKISVELRKTSSGNIDVSVNGQKVASNVPVKETSILKTGIYTSDKNASINKASTLGVEFTSIKASTCPSGQWFKGGKCESIPEGTVSADGKKKFEKGKWVTN